MDFHSLSRKELQSLCKKNKIPANITNIAMADALKSLDNVEGLDELINTVTSDSQQSPARSMLGSPDIPRTATQRRQINATSESLQSAISTRRSTRRTVVEETPAVQTSRRRAMVTASARMETEGKREEKSVQRMYSTRRSVRLLEKTMAHLSLEGENGVPGRDLDASQKSAEKFNDSEFFPCQNLDQSMEQEKDVEQEIQEGNKTNENEAEDCDERPQVFSEGCDNLDNLSGLDVGLEDDVEGVDKLDLHVENSQKSMSMSCESNNENGPDVSINESSEAQNIDFKSEIANDLNGIQDPQVVGVPDNSSGFATEMEDNSVVKASEEVSAEVIDHCVAEGFSPSHDTSIYLKLEELKGKSPEINLTDEQALLLENVSNEKIGSGNESEVPGYIMDNQEPIKVSNNLVTEPCATGEFSDHHVEELIESSSTETELIEVVKTVSDLDSTQISDKHYMSLENSVNDHEILTEELIESGATEAELIEVVKTISDLDSTQISEKCDRSLENSVNVHEIPAEFSDHHVEALIESGATEAELTEVVKTISDLDSTQVSDKHERSLENSVNVHEIPAEEFAKSDHEGPSAVDKRPTTSEKMNPCQAIASSGNLTNEIVSSPFAAGTLQGQFPRPTMSTPKKSSSKSETTIEIVNHALDIYKENIDNNGKKSEPTKDQIKETETDEQIPSDLQKLSLRKLTKMVKELQISNKQGAKTRVALQTVSENSVQPEN